MVAEGSKSMLSLSIFLGSTSIPRDHELLTADFYIRARMQAFSQNYTYQISLPELDRLRDELLFQASYSSWIFPHIQKQAVASQFVPSGLLSVPYNKKKSA